MSGPRISVVMPVYNGRRYLAESIESVLAQEYGDFELVVCDDGSSDDSMAVLRDYTDPRIRLLTNPANRGLFPTLNRLIGEARGKFVRFWSQDDRMDPRCLEVETRFWSRHPDIALSYCQGNVIDSTGAVAAAAPADETPEVLPPWLSTQIALYHGCLQANIATVTARREVLEEAGPFADLRVSGDFEMWTRIAMRFPIGFIGEPLVDVRRHPGQFSQSPRERLTFVREDRLVTDRLFEALPVALRPHVDAYRRRQQLVWAMHAAVSAAVRGELALARAVIAELRPQAAIAPLALRWALTANGALFKPRPLYMTPAGDADPSPKRLLGRPAGRTEQRSRTPIRLTVVLTHPVQYYAPWFRELHRREELALSVIYAVEPTPEQQGVGFDRAFTWDTSPLDGYPSTVIRRARSSESVDSSSYRGLDVPEIADAIRDSRPDVVLVPGWYSITLVRALRACRRLGVPVLYRGDTHGDGVGRGLRAIAWRLHSRRRLRLFDGYLSVGSRARAYLQRAGVTDWRIFHAPHAVDNAYFADAAAAFDGAEGRAAARRALGLPADRFVVLFAGKLEAKKRPLDLIRALAGCDFPVALYVAGSGALEQECRREADRLGVEVVWGGFVNQSAMPRVYAAADCLVLPSDWGETWGLVINEALASGLPCVASDRVGAAPDLIDESVGATYRCGDLESLRAAIERVRQLTSDPGHRARCCARVSESTVEALTDALLSACDTLIAPDAPRGRPVRVVACCGQMVDPGGLERMSFEVLGALRSRHVPVHCLFNPWGSAAVVPLAQRIGATWSTGQYRVPLSRRPRGVWHLVRMAADLALTSISLFRHTIAFGATHVFVPEYSTALRNAPALLLLRLLGRRVVMRLGHAPDATPFYQRLWRRAINPLCDRIIGNSQFIGRELRAAGIPPGKIGVITNCVSRRPARPVAAAARDRDRIIFVGQLIPEKGLDLLLDAMALIRRRHPRAHLEVIGRTGGWVAPRYAGYREALFARAAQPDLAGAVEFLGWREDVLDRLASAAVHCCPSRAEQREGFGNVVLEAKHSATPSVVFRSGALPELIAHRTDGWICDDFSAASLAEGLEFFLTAPEVAAAAGAVARESAAERYSPAAFVDRWTSVFGVHQPDREPRRMPAGAAAALGVPAATASRAPR
jgi:glycosyltransferase involved in cell wall biosynthesis